MLMLQIADDDRPLLMAIAEMLANEFPSTPAARIANGLATYLGFLHGGSGPSSHDQRAAVLEVNSLRLAPILGLYLALRKTCQNTGRAAELAKTMWSKLC
jgi:predicted secreted protein